MSFFTRKHQDSAPFRHPANRLDLPPQIYSFLIGLADHCGVPLAPAQKEDAVVEMAADFNLFVAGRLSAVLPEQTFLEFTRLRATSQSPNEVHAYIVAHIPDAQGFFMGCFIDFRNLYLAVPNSSRQVVIRS